MIVQKGLSDCACDV